MKQTVIFTAAVLLLASVGAALPEVAGSFKAKQLIRAIVPSPAPDCDTGAGYELVFRWRGWACAKDFQDPT